MEIIGVSTQERELKHFQNKNLYFSKNFQFLESRDRECGGTGRAFSVSSGNGRDYCCRTEDESCYENDWSKYTSKKVDNSKTLYFFIFCNVLESRDRECGGTNRQFSKSSTVGGKLYCCRGY